MITIYTDGSSRGNPGSGGWGAVIFHGKLQKHESGSMNQEWVTELGGREEHTTNNRMELMAAIEALKFASKLSTENCVLFTDSKYVMMGITEWIHNWVKKGWRTASKKPVLNQDLWQELLVVTERIESAGQHIEWKYVEGHAGHKHNERADIIATSFADHADPQLHDGPKSEYK